VSGAAALLLQRRPNLTPNQVKALLVGTTQPYGWNSGQVLPDPIADGSGLLDAYAAMIAARDTVNDDSPTTGDVPLGALLLPGALLPDALQAAVGPACVNCGLRPADGFARALYPVLFGSPLNWNNPFLGGIPWFLLTWDTLAWNSVAWDNFAWDSVAWDSVAWDSIAWDSIAWDSIAWDSVAWDSIAWDAFTLD
jgi:serine protease AprX